MLLIGVITMNIGKKMDLKDYLFPADLQATDEVINNILLIGSCASELYLKKFKEAYPNAAADLFLFNNISDLPDVSDEALRQYQLQVVQLPLRFVIGDGVVHFKEFTMRYHEFETDALNKLDLMFDAAMKYNQQNSLLTIVMGFIVPQPELVAGLANCGSDGDLRKLVMKLNDRLIELSRQNNNTYFFDVENVASVIGKRHFLDDFITFSSHNAFWYDDWHHFEGNRIETVNDIQEIAEWRLGEYVDTIFRGIERIYRIVNQIDQVKMVIFDLDDTMWRGIIGEHYGEAPYPIIDGWPLGMQEVVNYLKARGIITAVCSKNSLELVKERWDRASPFGFLTLDDFTFVEISWDPKVQGILKLISQANLTPKSVVFIDDNPVERNSVKDAIPDIRVLAAHPFKTRRILLNAPETQVATITCETLKREDMIIKGALRDKERAKLSREDFLNSLNCKVEIFKIKGVEDPNFARTFELLNKTNQFNTNGKRWRQDELIEFMNSGNMVYAFRVSDKYTDYGLVGVILLHNDRFEQFVMSCRVLGLEVESGVINYILNSLTEANNPLETFKASIDITKENMPCRTVYENAGFSKNEDGEHMEFSISKNDIREIPQHLNISVS